ncbi:hypothetical protein Lfu02_49640 [Longispora fulva]|uniref:Uncharacterized protein (TIGR02466 family) n=1 Tax=Longispora fulva TaxID=619741 RepID=A0A8J7GG52_9ACTN|nr:TIGR02466 family protein [Longispora fulva]MBG6138339.1 uncharacterized protein (TIGR02466 family) [Longispora fulva]GIG60592.1 hypothetical protein Lfu02_49640 [Longispora fulva]
MTTAVIGDADVLATWPTPFYQHDLTATRDPAEVAEINTQLRELILSREHDQTPVTFAVIGATKTSLDILQLNHPAVDWLRARIGEAVQAIAGSVGATTPTEAQVDVVAEGWAVVYRDGASHRLHTHHASAWSGTYYIATGGVDGDAGHLQVIDPRPAAIARHASGGVHAVEPKPGLLVAFPSWLPHSVKATVRSGGGLRICVAFNAAYVERIAP